jgi:4-amino-4-deoxy-L-arabinose transferase-like glycosyltransferase
MSSDVVRTDPRLRVAAVTGLRRHWAFAALCCVGLALRIITIFAYEPAIFAITDSYWYLQRSENLSPEALRPVGYSAFLKLLPLGLGLGVVTFVQHVLGLLVAAVLYSTLVRLGVQTWLAALATTPVLLDAYVLNIEHHILAETFFHALLIGACAALLWHRPLGRTAAGIAGLFLAGAALTRPIGTLIILPAVVSAFFLSARGRRVATVLVLIGSFIVPLGTYMVWFHSVHGVYGLSRQGGRYLYGRVAHFADCSQFSVPVRERPLCPTDALRARLDAYGFTWGRGSPVRRVNPPPGKTRDEMAEAFARRVIRNQPLDYAAAVGEDVLRGFAPVKMDAPTGFRVAPWKFRDGFPTFFVGRLCPPGPGASRGAIQGCRDRAERTQETIRFYGGSQGEANRDLTAFLRAYQRFGYVPGPLLLAAFVLVVAAVAGLGTARYSRLRVPAFLFAGFWLSIGLGTAAASNFSWRYTLPQLFLLPAAGALALTAFKRGANGARDRPDAVQETGSEVYADGAEAGGSTGQRVC